MIHATAMGIVAEDHELNRLREFGGRERETEADVAIKDVLSRKR